MVERLKQSHIRMPPEQITSWIKHKILPHNQIENMESTPPLYAIIELLIRASDHNPLVGEYEWHQTNDDHTIVYTTTGCMKLPGALIRMQEWEPMMITSEDLKQMADNFKVFTTLVYLRAD